MGVQESTAQQMVSDPTLVHVLVRFLSGGNPHGTSQHSSQVLSLMRLMCMTVFTVNYLGKCLTDSSSFLLPGRPHCNTSLAGVFNQVAGAPVLHLSTDVQ